MLPACSAGLLSYTQPGSVLVSVLDVLCLSVLLDSALWTGFWSLNCGIWTLKSSFSSGYSSWCSGFWYVDSEVRSLDCYLNSNLWLIGDFWARCRVGLLWSGGAGVLPIACWVLHGPWRPHDPGLLQNSTELLRCSWSGGIFPKIWGLMWGCSPWLIKRVNVKIEPRKTEASKAYGCFGEKGLITPRWKRWSIQEG